MSNAAEVLEAGGVIAAGATRPDSEVALDVLEARAFAHPGLGAPVVRLSLEPLASAIDAEMNVLGFAAGESLGAVGVTRRRGLGFPGAAIVADPENARYALEVVSEFAKAARRARSKPGHAKAEIDAIGERLGRSVPHFLPSFYEEASRTFLEHGNQNYAGQMFEKAREAERVHALDVDESLRENTFVEFALAGALSVKSLTNYARELASSSDPAEAYAVFRRVCVRRTLGGLPPWAKMGAELKRLIKAAGLDVAAEERSLVSEIIDAPALDKAQAGFWKSYKKTLELMCSESPATRAHLLNLLPDIEVDEWLGLLETCGAIEGIVSVDADPASRPAAGPAAWFARLTGRCGGWRSDLPPSVLELFERAAPVLAAAGKPLTLSVRWGDWDLDLTELALSLGLPLADPEEHADFDGLGRWAERAASAEVFGRDPVHVAGDPRFSRMLDEAIASEIGDEPFTSLAMTMDGFKGAIHRWLEARVSELDGAVGLPGLGDLLETLGRAGLVPVWRAFDDQRERLAAVSVAGPLALTLRAGIYDEYRWPAFEEALGRLAEKAEVKIGGAFPHLVVSDGIKAVVVGPTSIIGEFDLALPKGADLEGFRYVQDQLLVIFEPEDDWRSHGYWSGNPSETFEIEGSFYSYGVPDDRGVVLDDGAVVFSDHTMVAGDRRVGSGEVICDGASFWASDYDGYRELDPRTNKRGRRSAPAFVSELAREGAEISYGGSALYPLPAEITASPLGQRDGLYGLRIRHRDEASPAAGSVPMTEVERIDGKAWSHAGEHQTPDALLCFPGDDAPRPIETGYDARIVAPDRDTYIAASVDHPHYRRGSRMLPPLSFWHCFVPRDPAGSDALRRITAEQAELLVAAAERDLEAAAERGDDVFASFDLDGTALAAAVAESLPAIEDPQLAVGIAGLALVAATQKTRLARIAALTTDAGGDRAAGDRDPSGLAEAVRGLVWLDEDQGNIAELRWLSEIFESAQSGSPKKPPRVFSEPPRADCDWLPLLASVATLAYRAALASTPENQRRALIALLEAVSSSWLFDNLDHIRLIELEGKLDQVDAADQAVFFSEGDHLYYAWSTWGDDYKVVEHAPGGAFRNPAGSLNHDPSETRFTGGWRDRAALDEFLSSLADRGAVEIEPLAERIADPTGLSKTEGLFVLSGSPNDHDALAQRYGLKKSRLEQAITGARISDADCAAIFGAAIAADPNALWRDPDGFADSFAAAWTDRVGRFTPLDEDFVEATAKELRMVQDLPRVLRMIGDPSRGTLATDTTWKLDPDSGRLEAAGEAGFEVEILEEITPVFGHLFFHVEVGHPIRSQLPAALEAIGQRLKAEGLFLSMPDLDFESPEKRAAFLADFGGEPIVGAKNGRERDGIRLIPDDYDALEVWIRPTVLRDARPDIDRLIPLMGWVPEWLKPLQHLYEGGLARFADRIDDTPVPVGGYECNPIASAPTLVEEVGGDLDLDQNAAALYLQLASLPAPREKSIKQWNGWSPKVFKKAAARLLERGLIVEAKRSRAGRTHFVPGGWEALKAPLVPIETWKLDLYGIERKDGRIRPWELPFRQIMPSVPAHEVFAEAYRRIKAGEGPAYEAPGA